MAQAKNTTYDQFILFGDSITQIACEDGTGFHTALQKAYMRKLDIINRGFAGYTTAHAVKVLPRFFPTPEMATVRFMTIFFGANDACVPGSDQHVPLSVYRENLKTIINYPTTVSQKPRILLLTPPPVNEYQLEGFDAEKNTPHPSRTAGLTKQYADAARDVGTELDVPVIDLWSAFMTAARWEEGQPLLGSRESANSAKLASFFTDGLHLTPDGYRIVFEQILDTIRRHYPDQDPQSPWMVFPPWGEALH